MSDKETSKILINVIQDKLKLEKELYKKDKEIEKLEKIIEDLGGDINGRNK